MMKGHLEVTENTARDCYEGYFRRAWGNHEWVTHGEGFEEAWKKYQEHLMVKQRLTQNKFFTRILMSVFG